MNEVNTMDGRISNLRQIASLRRYALVSGREKGLEVIDCDNGKLRFLLNVTKGLDIMQVYHEEQKSLFNEFYLVSGGYESLCLKRTYANGIKLGMALALELIDFDPSYHSEE